MVPRLHHNSRLLPSKWLIPVLVLEEDALAGCEWLKLAPVLLPPFQIPGEPRTVGELLQVPRFASLRPNVFVGEPVQCRLEFQGIREVAAVQHLRGGEAAILVGCVPVSHHRHHESVRVQ